MYINLHYAGQCVSHTTHQVTLVNSYLSLTTADWSWLKEWNWCTQADRHLRGKKGQAGYVLLNPPPNPGMWERSHHSMQEKHCTGSFCYRALVRSLNPTRGRPLLKKKKKKKSKQKKRRRKKKENRKEPKKMYLVICSLIFIGGCCWDIVWQYQLLTIISQLAVLFAELASHGVRVNSVK